MGYHNGRGWNSNSSCHKSDCCRPWTCQYWSLWSGCQKFYRIFLENFEPEKSFTYTRMKRKHWLNTQVGAIVGAIPPLMGYTAASGGSFGIEGTCVAAMLFFWQFPHYYALAANKNQDRVISNVFCAIKLLFQVLFDPPKPATISRFPMKLDQK